MQVLFVLEVFANVTIHIRRQPSATDITAQAWNVDGTIRADALLRGNGEGSWSSGGPSRPTEYDYLGGYSGPAMPDFWWYLRRVSLLSYSYNVYMSSPYYWNVEVRNHTMPPNDYFRFENCYVSMPCTFVMPEGWSTWIIEAGTWPGVSPSQFAETSDCGWETGTVGGSRRARTGRLDGSLGAAEGQTRIQGESATRRTQLLRTRRARGTDVQAQSGVDETRAEMGWHDSMGPPWSALEKSSPLRATNSDEAESSGEGSSIAGKLSTAVLAGIIGGAALLAAALLALILFAFCRRSKSEEESSADVFAYPSGAFSGTGTETAFVTAENPNLTEYTEATERCESRSVGVSLE